MFIYGPLTFLHMKALDASQISSTANQITREEERSAERTDRNRLYLYFMGLAQGGGRDHGNINIGKKTP